MARDPRLDKFIEVLFDDDVKGDYKKAKKKAGFDPSTTIKYITDTLKEEIVEAIHNYMLTNGIKAAVAMQEIMDDPVALGNKNKFTAAKDILDRAGFKESEKVEVKAESPLFVLPPKS